MRTVQVVLTDVELAPGLLADVWMDVQPDTPGRRSGHPDTWTPPEPGWAEPTAVRLHVDEDTAKVLGVDAEQDVDPEDFEAVLGAVWDDLEMQAREAAC
jgi:hypothetical protein